jgi:hypothetical protein
MLQTAKTTPSADKIARSAAEATIAAMADKMRVLALNNVTVDADALGEDFTEAEIATHWRAARDRARAMSVRQVGKAA